MIKKPLASIGILTIALNLANHGDAKAATWWILDSQSEGCFPSSYAVNKTRNPAFGSPFTLAAEMREKGRLDNPIDKKLTTYGAAYAVFYDGVTTAYFTSKGGCEEFLSSARSRGDLPR